mmetsp:Transcript_46933/g.105183  ORF Transcript_46933/g.105183 Transcript_46933/m.105183 type:complete len:119 (+) Transcript_46933:366-722(+)
MEAAQAKHFGDYMHLGSMLLTQRAPGAVTYWRLCSTRVTTIEQYAPFGAHSATLPVTDRHVLAHMVCTVFYVAGRPSTLQGGPRQVPPAKLLPEGSSAAARWRLCGFGLGGTIGRVRQ